MLKVILNDGVRRLAAFEHEEIPFLKETTEIGRKLVIEPDFEIRRGNILMNKKNTKLL